MAIDFKMYTEQVAKGIKSTPDCISFFFTIYVEGKKYRKTINYSKQTAWGKRERIKNAKIDFINFEDEVISKIEKLDSTLKPDTKLNIVANEYFNKACVANSKWTQDRARLYELYIQNLLGSKAVSKITLNDMNSIKTTMEKKGLSKQTENGCSSRTINKVLIQTLMPILQYAMDNNAIDKLPPFKKIKNTATKKEVENGTKTLVTLFKAIMTRFTNVPYYRAMFLFALYGRRWNEIATLRTNDINIEHMTYTIRAENSKINKNKTFALPQPILAALLELQPDDGLVFKSPKTGGRAWTPKKQLQKLKEDTGIKELTMHYFRHVMATALVEMGETSAVAAATLGHSNTQTTEQYYATFNTQKSSQSSVATVTNVLTSKD